MILRGKPHTNKLWILCKQLCNLSDIDSYGQWLEIPQLPPMITKRHSASAVSHSDCLLVTCLLYTSPSPRDATLSRMPSSA